MKRTVPLRAHTGLRRGPGPERSAPLPRARQSGPRRSTAQRAARAVQLATWTQVRAVVLERDGHRCVGCGRGGRLDVHHRVFKGAGGSRLVDVPANAITLCGPGNTAGCHGVAHSEKNGVARERGWSLPHGTDPTTVPVLYPDGGRYLLDNDGGRRRVA